MRRNNIAKSVNHVVRALTASGLNTALSMARTDRRKASENDFNMPLLTALNKYSIEFQQFNDLELNISAILHLDELADPKYWGELIQSGQDPVKLFETIQRVNFAINFLPQFCQIIVPDFIRFDTSKEEPDVIIDKGKGLLSCVLYDNPSAPFTVDRFVLLFSSVSTLYETSSIVLGEKAVPLVLMSCDSGDEKSFDFLGAAKVIQMVKEILLSLWNRIVYFREFKLSQRLDLVSQALPILEEIGRLQESKTIAPEQAGILKRDILASVGNFIKSGAITPEMEAVSKIDPIMLMTPEPKQLTEGDDTVNKDKPSV